MIAIREEVAPNELKGIVFQIQRMSTEDGPGIRTTVFFKGCSLKCIWCHNPESISPRPQIHWIGVRCIGCQTCVNVCPNSALTFTPDGISINRKLCKACGTCATECPSTAMELLGKECVLNDLLEEVEKDRAYFESSNGGITVSGGEPSFQSDFVAGFLKGCKERGLHTALDTCGQSEKSALDRLLPYCDMVLYDLKEIDAKKHREFTGHSNERILKNLIHIRDYIQAHHTPKELWIRTPIIPDATARDSNIMGIGKFISKNLGDTVKRWELCSFNNLCRDKYIRLGMNWNFSDYDLLPESFMEHITRVAKRSGIDPGIVLWSGATRLEHEKAERPEGPRLRLVKCCSTA